MRQDEFDSLKGKIKSLNELLWEGRVDGPALNQWLENFVGESLSADEERLHALHLLSKFMYFGQREIWQLSRAMFQDLFRHPISMKIRSSLINPSDFEMVHDRFIDELKGTRFLGLGNPSESGMYLLYPFRTANDLPEELFSSADFLCSHDLNVPNADWAFSQVRRVVFMDDFCGTGSQAVEKGEEYVPAMRQIAESEGRSLHIWYLALVASTSGLEFIREHDIYDHVESVSELDTSYRAFGDDSQIYSIQHEGIEKERAADMAGHYGGYLHPDEPLGFGDCQFLLGFNHNVPDNTLPIIWKEDPNRPWHAIFPRAVKY